MALARSESNTEPLLLLRREGLPTCEHGKEGGAGTGEDDPAS